MHDSLAVEYSSEDDFRLDVALGFVDFYSDFSNKYQLPYKNLMPSLPQMIRLPANIGHGYCECCRRGKLKDH